MKRIFYLFALVVSSSAQAFEAPEIKQLNDAFGDFSRAISSEKQKPDFTPYNGFETISFLELTDSERTNLNKLKQQRIKLLQQILPPITTPQEFKDRAQAFIMSGHSDLADNVTDTVLNEDNDEVVQFKAFYIAREKEILNNYRASVRSVAK